MEIVSGQYEKPPVKVARDPGMPTAEEVEEHSATHLPHRSWCPVCVKARGKEDAHKQVHKDGKPIVSLDYKAFGEEAEEDDKVTMIVVKDEKTGSMAAHMCQQKGASDTWVVERICDDLDMFGHTEIILKGDGEPALVQVQGAVKNRRAHSTICQNPPAYNPQANGAVERAVQEVMNQIRVMKIGLEQRLATKITTDWKIMEWITELSAVLLNRCLIGKDGRTPYHRLIGKDSQKTLVEIGERVLAKIARGQQSGRKQSLKAKWEDAVWVGIAKKSNEHIVVLEGGGPAIRCRTIKRRTAVTRWDADKVAEIRASPRYPNPKDLADQDVKTESKLEAKVKKPLDEKIPVPEVQQPRDRKRRNFRISKKVLEKYGYAAGCPGCEAMMDGTKAKEHLRECRDRIENAMEEDPVDHQKIRDRDERVYKENADGAAQGEEELPPGGDQEGQQASNRGEVQANREDDENILYGGQEDEDQEEERGAPAAGLPASSASPRRCSEDDDREWEELAARAKRRRLDLTHAAKLLAKRLDLPKYGPANRIQSILKSMDDNFMVQGKLETDITDVMKKVDEVNGSSPHDDEDWQRMCEGIKFYDDVNGGEELDKKKVVEARKLEMQFFKKMGVYSKVSKDDVKEKAGKIITTKWVDTDKGMGKYRSRLVGREIKKDKRQDLFSPTPPLEVLKLLIAKCAKSQGGQRPKRIGIIDVSRAYFYARCRRPLYIQIPMEDWEDGDEHRVGKLHLSLYGTRDAAQNWAATYTEHLVRLGFVQGKASLCNFRHESKDIDLTVHGDDFLIVADSIELKWLEQQMKERYEVKCNTLGPDEGMQREARILNRTLKWLANGITYESDTKHAKIVVKECGVETGRVAKVPGSKRPEEPGENRDLTPGEASVYRAVVARLNYLALDRVDLQFAAKTLSRKMSAPTEADWEELRRTARYLRYRPRAMQIFRFEALGSELSGYADSDWAGEKPSMKSTSGGALMWGNSLLKSWSTTQSTVALSSAEAELYALSKCAQQALSMTSLAADFKICVAPIIYSDASAALGIVLRSGLGGKTRHVQVQYLWIQGAVQREELRVRKVSSRENPSDALTKYLPEEAMQRHTQHFGFSFPDTSTDKDASQFVQRLRCFAKHVNLAEQQRQYLSSTLCTDNGSASRGGIGNDRPCIL